MSNMKFRDLTNIDLYILSKELQFLVGSRIRKVYQYSENEFKIKFSVPEKGSVDVAVLLPYTIHVTKQTKESSEPTNFIMVLRKYLENKKIEKAAQWDLDRIFVFEFLEYKLIIEFFGKGNLILTDSNNKIISSSRREETKARTIKREEVYKFPESQRINPNEMPSDLYNLAMQEKEKEKLHLIAFLSKKINFPPFYWEEILFKTNAEPLLPLAKCTEKTFQSITKHTKDFMEELKNPNLIIYSDGTYSIIPLKKNRGEILEHPPTLSDLMDKFYLQMAEKEISSKTIEKVEKVQRKLQQQKKYHGELLIKVDEMQKTGKTIVENERKMNLLIEEYKKMKKENRKSEEIEKRLSDIFGSEIKIEKGKIIFEID